MGVLVGRKKVWFKPYEDDVVPLAANENALNDMIKNDEKIKKNRNL